MKAMEAYKIRGLLVLAISVLMGIVLANLGNLSITGYSTVELNNTIYVYSDTIMDEDFYNSDYSYYHVIIEKDNVKLDCNDLPLIGNETGIGIYSNKNNITLENCFVVNYEYGIVLTGNDSNLINTRAENNLFVDIMYMEVEEFEMENAVADNASNETLTESEANLTQDPLAEPNITDPVSESEPTQENISTSGIQEDPQPPQDPITILSGNAPTHSQPILNSTNGLFHSSENLTVYNQSTNDGEGDNVTNSILWLRNKRSFPATHVDINYDNVIFRTPFENYTVSTDTYKDYSVSDSTITVSNTVWNATGGHDGYGAYKFTGTTGYLKTTADIGEGEASLTVLVWVKPSPSPAHIGDFVTKRNVYYTLQNISNNVWVYLSGLSSAWTRSSSTLSTTNWNHVAWTKSGSTLRLYINGQEDSVSPVTLTSSNPLASGILHPLTIGNVVLNTGAIDADRGFDGHIDDVMILDVALSADQIKAMYDRTSNIIRSDETEVSDTWQACITPNDGTSDGATNCSDTKTILLSNPPTHSQPILSSTSGNNLYSDNLTVYNQSTIDINGDSVSNIINWYRNDTSIAVLNMPFDSADSAGSGKTKDYSGSGNNGTLAGHTVWTSDGYLGGAYYFDGTNDYIDFGNDPDLSFERTDPFSISAWVKIDDVSSVRLIFSKLAGPTAYPGYQFFVHTNGQIYFDLFRDSSTTKYIRVYETSNEGVADGGWHQVTATYDGSSTAAGVKIYLDGDAVSTTVGQDTLDGSMLNSVSAYIGTRSDGSYDYKGYVDEVNVFNRELSPEQINALYNNRTDLIVSQETEVSDIWKACITPNDGFVDGVTNCSTSLTIVSNIPPTHNQPILNSTLGTNLTTENLTVYNQSTSDLEGDGVNNSIRWLRNSRSYPATPESVSYTNMVLNMPFENYTGLSDNSADHSLYGNNGTVYGNPVWNSTGGHDGYAAYDLDGTGDYIEIADDASLESTQISLGAWVKREGTMGTGVWHRRIISKNYQTTFVDPFDSYALLVDNSVNYYIGFNIGWGTGGGKYTTYWTSTPLPDGEWTHLFMTVNQTQVKLYMNGNLLTTQTAGGNPIYNNGPLRIGAMDPTHASERFFNGKIDDVRIYDLSLTADQIKEIYQNKSGVIQFNETSIDDVWQACITPYDAYGAGSENCSNNLTVLAPIPNYAPVVSDIVLNATDHPSNTTNANLTVYYNLSDLNDDNITKVINWYRNDSSITVLNMPFDSNNSAGTGKTKDYSGYENNGTETGGVAWTSQGYISGAYDFAGDNDYIQIADDDILSFGDTLTDQPLTISAWVNMDAATLFPIVAKDASTSNVEYVFGTSSADYLVLTLYDLNSANRIQAYTATGVMTPYEGIWTQLVAVYDGFGNESGINLYIDGVLQTGLTRGEVGTYEAMHNTNAALFIGKRETPNQRYANSRIDDVRVFNRELSTEQIKALYNNRTNLIVSQETNVNDIWKACITPNDGQVDGSTNCSNNLTVLVGSNQAPTQTQPILNSSDATNKSASNLTVYTSIFDPNGDNTTAIINWYKDSSSISVLNMPFEGGSTSGSSTGPTNGTTKDYSGYGNNGTAIANSSNNGPQWSSSSGYIGGAYTFDGVDDYIEVNHSSSLNIENEITLSAWVKSNEEGYVVVKDPSAEQQTAYYINKSDCDYIPTWDDGTCVGQTLTEPQFLTIGQNTLTCNYTDTLLNNVEVTSVTLYGAHNVVCTNGVQYYWNGTLLGTSVDSSTACNFCLPSQDLNAPYYHNFTLTNPNYSIGGINTFSFTNLAGGNGYAGFIGGHHTPALGLSGYEMFKVTVNYTVSGKYTPFSLSTINGGEFLIGNDNYRAISSGSINDGNWHHIAATYNGSEMRLYVDGKLNATNTSFSGSLPTNTDPVWIGRNYDPENSTGYFNGTIDEVQIYPAALSAQQIKALYNNRTDLIVSQETSGGEKWQACVTPNDGQVDGSENCSNSLTVREVELTIWDDNDLAGGNQNKTRGELISFYANYTENGGIGPINNSIGWCNLTINTTPDGPYEMSYNSTSGLWYHNRSFNNATNYQWNVTCNSTGYEQLTKTDTITVYPDCVTPEDEYQFESNSLVNFCSGSYSLGATGSYYQFAYSFYLDNTHSNITFICDDTILNGPGAGSFNFAFLIMGSQNISIIGCNFSNFVIATGLLNNFDTINLSNNYFSNVYSSIFIAKGRNFHILNNTLNGGAGITLRDEFGGPGNNSGGRIIGNTMMSPSSSMGGLAAGVVFDLDQEQTLTETSDIYIANNTIINSGGFGISLMQADSRSTINNITISNNNISNPSSYGIYIENASNVIVDNNLISGATYESIYSVAENSVKIRNNQIYNNNNRHAIYMGSSVEDKYGVLNGGRDFVISGNTINNSGGTGTRNSYFASLSPIRFNGYDFNGNGAGMIVFGLGSERRRNVFADNTPFENILYGVRGDNFTLSLIYDNVLQKNITFFYEDGFNEDIENCADLRNEIGSVNVYYCRENTLISNGATSDYTFDSSIFNSSFNVTPGYTNPPYLRYESWSYNASAIEIDSNTNVTISDNVLDRNDYGITISNSTTVNIRNITGTTVTSASYYGSNSPRIYDGQKYQDVPLQDGVGNGTILFVDTTEYKVYGANDKVEMPLVDGTFNFSVCLINALDTYFITGYFYPQLNKTECEVFVNNSCGGCNPVAEYVEFNVFTAQGAGNNYVWAGNSSTTAVSGTYYTDPPYINVVIANNVKNYISIEALNGGTIQNINLDNPDNENIDVKSSSDLIFKDITINSGGKGIIIDPSSNITIRDSTINSTSGEGILIFNNTNAIIYNNTITYNSRNGINISLNGSATITENTICYNNLFGIYSLDSVLNPDYPSLMSQNNFTCAGDNLQDAKLKKEWYVQARTIDSYSQNLSSASVNLYEPSTNSTPKYTETTDVNGLTPLYDLIATQYIINNTDSQLNSTPHRIYTTKSGFQNELTWTVTESNTTRGDNEIILLLGNAALRIWDDKDPRAGSQNKGSTDNIYFYANYTNSTSKIPIDDNTDGGWCNITISDNPADSFAMSYNSSNGLWNHNKTFGAVGSYSWNVTCNATNYESLYAIEAIYVNALPTHSRPLLIASDYPANSTYANLTVYNQSTQDNDVGYVANIINWFRNGNSLNVLNMPFEGGSTSGNSSENGTARDYSNYTNNGIVVNAAWNRTAGYNNFGAYEFDGAGDYIELPHSSSLDLTDEITISVWVKSNSEGYVVVKDPYETGQAIYYIENESCSGWDDEGCNSYNPYTYEGFLGNSSGSTLKCNYTDTLPTDVTIDSIEVQGAMAANCAPNNPIKWWWGNTLIGQFDDTDGRCGCNPDPPAIMNFSLTNPSYDIGGENFVYLNNSGNFASILGGSYAGYSTGQILKVTVNYTGGKIVPFSLSTRNGGEFFLRNNSFKVISTNSINDGDWHHLAATYNGSEMRLYVDGKLNATSTSYSGNLPTNSDPVWIGRHFDPRNLTGFFNGTLDEVQIYPIALSAEQIKAVYNDGTYVIVSQETYGGDTWKACITINDGYTDGATNCSNEVTIENIAPNFTFTNITPSPAYANDTLFVNITPLDEDSSTITVWIKWFVNGILKFWERLTGIFSGQTVQANLSSTYFNKSDNVTAEVTVGDNVDNATAQNTSALTIGNLAPSISAIGINSSNNLNTSADTITGYFVYSDADSDLQQSTETKWYIDDSYDSSFDNIFDIGPGNFTNTQQIIFSARVSDGTAWSNWANSSTLAIRNSAPFQDNPLLISIFGTNLTTENLSVQNISTQDYDGDNVENIINWYLNGTSLTTLNLPFASNHSAGTNKTRDYSGYGFNGTVYGANWNPGRSGYYEFDGVDDYIETNVSALNSSIFSIELWAKFNDYEDRRPLFAKATASDDVLAIGTDIFDGSTNIGLGINNGGWDYVESQTNPVLGQWYHIVGVQNSTSKLIYIDGELENTESNVILPAGNTIFIGKRRFGGAIPINGSIAAVRIYNNSLTSAQIKALYNNRTDMIVSEQTSDGDIWQACMTPNDGSIDGTEKCSNNILVLPQIGEQPVDTGFGGGNTTNFDTVPNLSDVDTVVLHNDSYMKLNWTSSGLNVSGANFSETVIFGEGWVNINLSTISTTLNSSATIELYNLPFEETPIVYIDGVLCTQDCDIIGYSGTTLIFNVSHFTNYSTGPNSQLMIWDDTDPEGGSQSKIINDSIFFIANYTNVTSGKYIDNVSNNGWCNISFSYDPIGPFEMIFNYTGNNTWAYNRSFNDSNTYNWNVSCNATNYELFELSDQVYITPLENRPPTHSKPIISSTNGFNRTTDNITVYNQSTNDPDRNNLTNIVDWRKDGGTFAILNAPFDTNSSNVVRDYSNNESNLSASAGVQWTPNGYIGGGYYFDDIGNNDYLNYSLNKYDFGFSGSDQMTVMAWVYADRLGGETHYIVENDENWIFYVNADRKVVLTLISSGGSYWNTYRCDSPLVQTGRWYHITGVVIDSTKTGTQNAMKIYFDGQECITPFKNPNTGWQNLGSKGLAIGARSFIGLYGQNSWNGTIDEFKIFPTALTEEQIKAIAQNKTDTIVSQETSVGDKWQACVTPNDGEYDGSTKCTNNLSVVLSHAPTHSEPVLNSTSGNGLSRDNLTVYNVSTIDIEPDNITNIINWKKDGSSITVLNMPFDSPDSAGSGKTKDYSDNENNGTNYGSIVWSPDGYYGGGYIFDGTDDYIYVPNTNSLTSFPIGLTVSVWVKQTGSDTGGIVLSRWGVSGVESGYGLHSNDNWYMGDGTNWGFISAGRLRDSNWHHYVLVWDTSTMTSYRDATYVDSTNAAGAVFNNPGNSRLVIGDDNRIANPGANIFSGQIDEVRIYNKTLSIEQINALYNNRTDLIVSQETSVGDTWLACVTPNDGLVDGAENCSNTVNIILSNPPTHSKPIINSTSGYNRIEDNLTVINQSTADIDGDAVRNIVNWYRNDSSIMVLNMPFDSNNSAGSGKTKDYSGYGNNGTINGATWTSSGYTGGGYDFDGTEDYIEIPNDASIDFSNTDPFSISAWVKTTQYSGMFVAKIDGSPFTGYEFLVYADQLSVWLINNYGGGNYLFVQETGTGAVNDGNWHHVTMTYNGSSSASGVKLYVDGSKITTTTEVDSLSASISSTTPVRIGERGDNELDYNGLIDEVLIYNHTLTPQQIKAVYNNRTDLIVSNETYLNDIWKACITPTDGFVDGATNCSDSVTVVDNFPPTHSQPILNSTLGTNKTDEDLTVYNRSTSDLDNDPVTNIIDWYVNSINQPSLKNQWTINSATTSKGQSWYACITPNDGTINGSINCSNTLTIENTGPGYTFTNITPETAYTNDTLSVNVTPTDIDSDTLTVWIKWFVNGILKFWEKITGIISGSIVQLNLSSSNFTKGDNVTAEVTIGDADVNLTPTNTSTISILNSLPTHQLPFLNSTTLLNRTDENLTVYNRSTTDPDGDEIKNIINWKLNSNSFAELNLPFEGGSNSTYTKDYAQDTTILVNSATWNAAGGYDNNGGYEFDGADDYIALDMNYSSAGEISELTVCAWYKTEYAGLEWNANGALVDFDNTEYYGLFVNGVNGNIVFRTTSSTGYSNSTVGATNTNDGSWHFACGVFDSSEEYDKKVYYDGALGSQQNNYPTGVNLGTGTTRFGFIGDTSEAVSFDGIKGSKYFNGSIDEVMIYHKALSAEQIKTLYNSRTDLIVSQETAAYDVWQSCITPNDGTADSTTLCSNEITVWDIPPEIHNVTMNSTDHLNRTNATLNGYFDYYEPSGALQQENETKWYKNNAEVSALANKTIISPSNTTKGEIWKFGARVYDGTSWSTWDNSSELTINNALPTQSSPLLSSSSGTNTPTENLTVYNQSTIDIDGDTVTNYIDWYLDGVYNSTFDDNNTINSNYTILGQIWKACITPYDGTINGTKLCSANLTIIPPAPARVGGAAGGGGAPPIPESCYDGVQNNGESGVDCGGKCPRCPSCSDGKMNCHDDKCEEGTDCGGPCAVGCGPAPRCNDGIKNGFETGIDCGGYCKSCIPVIKPEEIKPADKVIPPKELPEEKIIIEEVFRKVKKGVTETVLFPGRVSRNLKTSIEKFLSRKFNIGLLSILTLISILLIFEMTRAIRIDAIEQLMASKIIQRYEKAKYYLGKILVLEEERHNARIASRLKSFNESLTKFEERRKLRDIIREKLSGGNSQRTKGLLMLMILIIAVLIISNIGAFSIIGYSTTEINRVNSDLAVNSAIDADNDEQVIAEAVEDENNDSLGIALAIGMILISSFLALLIVFRPSVSASAKVIEDSNKDINKDLNNDSNKDQKKDLEMKTPQRIHKEDEEKKDI
ncbi:LamG-like jellyroll fold domain-containing protein [Nanoarchaeota archaeon]